MLPATAVPSSRRYPAFGHRNFSLIWSGLLVSNMGTWMQNVAQSWLVYKMTGDDPLWLGWLGLAFAVPMVVFPPIGGVVADRVDRVKLLYVTQTGAALLAAVLALLTWSGAVRPWHVVTTTSLGALLLAFDNPTRQAFIPELVPREHLQNALSLNSATLTGAALVGPAIAGGLLDVVGAGWLFMLNALSFLAVIGALVVLRDVPAQPRRTTSLRDALLGGFSYAWRHELIFSLIVLSALAAVFARSYQQLLPMFADGVWHAGAGGYGMLLSAGGAGALLGAFALSSARDIEHKGRVMLVSGVALSLVLVAFALARSFWLGATLVVRVGVAATVFTTMIATVIQLAVPSELRGRVISLYVITLIGLPSLGSLGVAALATALAEPARAAWTRPIRVALDLLAIGPATRSLGAAAGGGRARSRSARWRCSSCSRSDGVGSPRSGERRGLRASVSRARCAR